MSFYLLRGADGAEGGLGQLASDSIPRPVYEQCNPIDSVCVARNAAKGDAFEAARLAADNVQHLQWCLTQSGYPPSECYATYGPGGTIAAHANAGQPVQGFVQQPVLSSPQVLAQYAPAYAPIPGSTIDTPGGSVFVPTSDKTTVVSKALVPASVATTPSAAQQSALPAPDQTVGSPSTGGFDLSKIPWWAWAGVAAAAFFAFGGSERGR
jgi:hypothetical protein